MFVNIYAMRVLFCQPVFSIFEIYSSKYAFVLTFGYLLNLGTLPTNFNPLCVAVEKSRQCGTSSSHGGRENSTEKHQPVSEGISWKPHIVSSHTAPQKIAKKISFQVTENDMMVA